MTRKQVNAWTWALIIGALALTAILGQCVGGL
jgi:hypothetical protein